MNLKENIQRIRQVMGVINESQYSNNLKRRVHILDSLIDNLLPNMYPCDFDNEDDFFTGVYHELRHLIEDEQYGLENLDRKDMIEYIYQNRQDEIREYYRERCDNTKKKEQIEGKDPKTGTGKKPEGSSRRLYTDENPSDTVSVKFRTKEDIIDTLNKDSFKSKPHNRQSQIINLIHQRVRAAHQNAKDPETKQRLKRAYDYIESKKEQSKEKTIQLQKEGLNDKWTRGEDTVTLKQLLKITKDIPVTKMSTKKLMKHALHGDNPEEMKKVDKTSLKYPVLVLVSDNGLIKYILDGHHRIQKANKHDIKMVNVKLIKFSELPKEFKKVLG